MPTKTLLATMFVQLLLPCILPPVFAASDEAVPPAQETMTAVDAWTAAAQMTPGINIGNTLENTNVWEVGWGNS